MEIKLNKDTSDVIRDATTVARVVKKTMGRNSLTRMAQDSVFQFPLLISSSIDTDEVIVMAKAIEKQYASLLVSVFSLNGSVPIEKYETLQNYLKNFHSNKDIPSNIKAGLDFVFESATIEDGKNIPSGLGAACWDVIEEQLAYESINDIYKPYDRTKKVLEDKLTIAKEASEMSDRRQKMKDVATNIRRDERSESYGGMQNVRTDHTKKTETIGDKTTISERTSRNISGSDPKFMPAVVRNDKITALEPTMINVQFVFHGKERGQWAQNVVLGVKTMVRMVRSDLMVVNMTEAAKDSYGIFKFIKWTKGEYKFVKDFLFKTSEIKDIATTTSKDSSRWWKALKRRRAINSMTKFFKNNILPNTTIIMTSYEVEQVSSLCGVNLAEVHNALNLISKYYLLGFGIYDTESQTLSMLFDGDTDFATSSISSLRSGNNRDTDLTNMKEMMKLMGRI